MARFLQAVLWINVGISCIAAFLIAADNIQFTWPLVMAFLSSAVVAFFFIWLVDVLERIAENTRNVRDESGPARVSNSTKPVEEITGHNSFREKAVIVDRTDGRATIRTATSEKTFLNRKAATEYLDSKEYLEKGLG